ERTHQARLRLARHSAQRCDRPARRRQNPGPDCDAARGRTRVRAPTPVTGQARTLSLTAGLAVAVVHKLGVGRAAVLCRAGSVVVGSMVAAWARLRAARARMASIFWLVLSGAAPSGVRSSVMLYRSR